MNEPTATESLSILLKQPEYLHVVLHGFPIYGLFVAALGLIAAVAARNEVGRRIALGLVLATSLTVLPVEELGEKAEDPVEAIVDAAGERWIHEHEERAEKAMVFYWVTIGSAAFGLVASFALPRAATAAALLAAVTALGATGAGAWVAKAGGQIRHKEFRVGPQPPGEKHGEKGGEKHGGEEKEHGEGHS